MNLFWIELDNSRISMKHNLLFLSSAMFLTAMNAQAESFWLILQNSTYGIEKIEMKNMSQCEEQGKQYTKVRVILVTCA